MLKHGPHPSSPSKNNYIVLHDILIYIVSKESRTTYVNIKSKTQI